MTAPPAAFSLAPGKHHAQAAAQHKTAIRERNRVSSQVPDADAAYSLYKTWKWKSTSFC